MFKKIGTLFICFILTSCRSAIFSSGGTDSGSLDVSEITIESAKPFRVGVLLPLSGPAAKHGEGLRNATFLAVEDIKNPNLILQFYDTKSSPSGARIAIENALNQESQLIIGPLMSAEVKAISERTTSKGVPVIAFSTSEDVLQKDVYTLGLLIDEQVNRIMSYAYMQGKRNFALLLPDNSTGISTAKAAVRASIHYGFNIVKIAFYHPQTTDFSDLLSDMTNYKSRKGNLDKIKAGLSAQAKAGDAGAARQLKRLESKDSMGDVEFDAVLIPESGARLKSAIAMFGYYDVSEPKTKFLGTSMWEGTALSNEYMALNSWYPALPRANSAYFATKYNNMFGEKPNSLYSFAYEAIALANTIAKNPNYAMEDIITNPHGYAGINGAFRLFKNGTNQHSLDIVEVVSSGERIIDYAPKKFEPRSEFDFSTSIMVPENYVVPAFYGKDAATAQRLIFGYKIQAHNVQESVEYLQ